MLLKVNLPRNSLKVLEIAPNKQLFFFNLHTNYSQKHKLLASCDVIQTQKNPRIAILPAHSNPSLKEKAENILMLNEDDKKLSTFDMLTNRRQSIL